MDGFYSFKIVKLLGQFINDIQGILPSFMINVFVTVLSYLENKKTFRAVNGLHLQSINYLVRCAKSQETLFLFPNTSICSE